MFIIGFNFWDLFEKQFGADERGLIYQIPTKLPKLFEVQKMVLP